MKVIQQGRRRFLTGLTALTAATLSQRLLTRIVAAQSTPQPQLALKPYEMLVLGDSVVWGQGLPEEKKFYYIVRNELESQLVKRNVRMVVRAHSGATIFPRDEFYPRTYGEVPNIAPSLFAQTAMALELYKFMSVAPESVNLVLLNGGINDMGFPALINPFTSPEMVKSQARKFCGDGMTLLLTDLMSKFPNAQFIVTGYFPVISEKTDRNTLRDIILGFLGLKAPKVLMAAEQQKAGTQQPDWLFDQLNELSKVWKRESDSNLAAAVERANRADKTPLPGTTPPNCQRAMFVQVDFAPGECYNAGPETAFWRITGPLPPGPDAAKSTTHLITDDLVFASRQPQCRSTLLTFQDQQTCEVAGTGHPNVKGAQKYANAINARLRECLPFARAAS